MAVAEYYKREIGAFIIFEPLDIGAIIVLVISMTIGIPLGISIYEKMHKDKKLHKKSK